MPVLARLDGAVIRIYPDDHAPPHVHVVTPDGEAQVAIATGEVLRGKVKAVVLAEVRAFPRAERPRVDAAWRKVNGARKR